MSDNEDQTSNSPGVMEDCQSIPKADNDSQPNSIVKERPQSEPPLSKPTPLVINPAIKIPEDYNDLQFNSVVHERPNSDPTPSETTPMTNNVAVFRKDNDHQVNNIDDERPKTEPATPESTFPAHNIARSETIHREMRGEHCFILEAGATIRRLQIFGDTKNTDVRRYSAHGYPDDPSSAEDEPSAKEDFGSSNNLKRTTSTLSGLRRTLTTIGTTGKPVDNGPEPVGSIQLQYDGHMKPFPGIDDYRYHVNDSYVPVKIYRQHRKGGTKYPNPFDLRNLFSHEEQGAVIRSVLLVAECGKTSFCQNLLHKYSEGVQVISSFPCDTSLLFNVTLTKNLMVQLQPFLARIKGMNLLLIIDDYNPENRADEQQLKDLISRKHRIHDKDIGTRSVSILLTSRPIQNNLTLESFDRRVELGKFEESSTVAFLSKLPKELLIENVDKLTERVKFITGDPMTEINPLVLLTFCIALGKVKEFDISNILLNCKYMLAWRCQRRACFLNTNLFTKAVRLHRMPPFHEFKLSELKSKFCDEAQSIMEDSKFVVNTD